MKICIVSATQMEVQPLLEALKNNFTEYQPYHFIKGEKEVDLLITGVGAVQTVYSLTKYLQHVPPDLCIQAGIAGAYSTELTIGTVCSVIEEIFADLGAEDQEGQFIDAFQLGLIHADQPPFHNKRLLNPGAAEMSFLPKAKSISSNLASGTQETIDKQMNRYQPDIESMEGAAFFYTCLLEKVSFLEIRSISNAVEVRDRTRWDIPLAIKNLNSVLIEMIESL